MLRTVNNDIKTQMSCTSLLYQTLHLNVHDCGPDHNNHHRHHHSYDHRHNHNNNYRDDDMHGQKDDDKYITRYNHHHTVVDPGFPEEGCQLLKWVC